MNYPTRIGAQGNNAAIYWKSHSALERMAGAARKGKCSENEALMRSPSNSQNRDDEIGNSEAKNVLQSPLNVYKMPDEIEAVSNKLDNELTEEIQSPAANAKKLRQKKYRRVFAILVAPYIILFAPISLPILAYFFWRQLKRTDAKKQRAEIQAAREVFHAAFQTHIAGDHGSAWALLNSVKVLPAGAKPIFRALKAETDEDWLAAMRDFCSDRQMATIRLSDVKGTRFSRLSFDDEPPIFEGDMISVIMPVFNSENSIMQAANSILSQRWQNLELIIVDDCSTDSTAKILKNLESQDKRVRVLTNKVNVGPYVSKNRALRIARGKYVTGHDADDIATPGRINAQMEPIRQGRRASIAHMIRLNSNAKLAHTTKSGRFSYDGLARVAFISLLVERELLTKRLGFWDSVRFGADSEMFRRVSDLLGNNLAIVNDIVMLCLTSPSSLTGNEVHGLFSADREAYGKAFRAWHEVTAPSDRFLDFSQPSRKFEAPITMIVPVASVNEVVVDD